MPPEPDKADILLAVVRAIHADMAEGEPPDLQDVPEEQTAAARIVCTTPGTLAGLPVAEEVFRRMGGRLRSAVADGAAIAAGDEVAEVGGALRAILTARPTAIAFLERLSAIATGAGEPETGDPLDAYAAGLRMSLAPSVGHNGPRFELEVTG